MPGLPPADLLVEVAAAWEAAGLDVVECLRKSVSVRNEWEHKPGNGPLHDRLERRQINERRIPIVHRELLEMLRPQPAALDVIRKLLEWIDRADVASQRGENRPTFATLEGAPIFPPKEEEWWLTDVRRNNREPTPDADEDGPVTDVDDVQDNTEDEDPETDKESIGTHEEFGADGPYRVDTDCQQWSQTIKANGERRWEPRAG